MYAVVSLGDLVDKKQKSSVGCALLSVASLHLKLLIQLKKASSLDRIEKTLR